MILTLANQKGGVSKTTTAAALGQGLQLKGYKVLFIDLDPQGNLSYHLGADTLESPTIANVLEGTKTPEGAKQKAANAWEIIPSDHETSLHQHSTPPQLLRERIEPIKNKYDFIIIDTPPTLSALTINAFVAADRVIIPTTASTYATQGIIQLYQTIEQAQKLNPGLKLDGILLTRYTDRSIINRQIKKAIEALADKIGTKVYKTTIRQAIAVEEAQATKTALFEYAPKATAAKDYKDFIKEIERGIKK